MGATTFRVIGSGSSVQDAFRTLCNESREEYGHQQGYSGEIHDTNLCANKTGGYKNAKDKIAFLEKLEYNTNKRDTNYIVLKESKVNANKIKSTVTINTNKGARKWETRYEVYGFSDDRPIASEKTQGAAVKKARAYTEKNQETTHIELTKKLISGNAAIGSVRYKTSKSESMGSYLFVVCAPE